MQLIAAMAALIGAVPGGGYPEPAQRGVGFAPPPPELPTRQYEAPRLPSSNQRKRRLNARRAASHPASRKRSR
jgi:hypothetical protein